jgi:hypothetical protein
MAMEQTLQEILERLSAGQQQMKEMEARAEARQEKMKAEIEADINVNITASQERADADAKAHQEKADADAKAHQEKANAELKVAVHSVRTDIERSLHQQMGALLEGSRSFGTRTTICRVLPAICQTETTSCPEEMDATRLESTLEETEAPVERQELFKKEINAKNIASSEDRCEEQRLVVRRRRGVKKRSQDSVGSRQKLFAARKRVIRRAVPAVRKGHMRKGSGKNNVPRGTSRGTMLDKRQRNNSECEDGRLGRDLKKRLRLRTRRTSGRNFKKPIQLEKKKRIFGSTNGLCKASKWTFWKVRPPPKRKKEVRTT